MRNKKAKPIRGFGSILNLSWIERHLSLLLIRIRRTINTSPFGLERFSPKGLSAL
jgi:hypothetical protein